MNAEKTERVVVLFSQDELAELEIAMKVAARMRGQRNPKTSAFLRDVLLRWSDSVTQEAKIETGSEQMRLSV